MQLLLKSFFLPSQLCSTPAILTPIERNSTFNQIVTPCFTEVLVPSVPLLISLFSVCWLCLRSTFPSLATLNDDAHHHRRPLPISKLALCKLALSALDFLISLLNLSLSLALPAASYLGPNAIQPEQHNSAVFAVAFSLCCLLAYGQCLGTGRVTSGSLHLAWLLRSMSSLPQLVLTFTSYGPMLNVPANYVILAHLTISATMTLVLCRSDANATSAIETANRAQFQYERLENDNETLAHGQHQQQQQQKTMSPEASASAIGALTYWYASEIVWKGLRGTLTFEQLWSLEQQNQSKFLRDRFYNTATTAKDQLRNLSLFNFYWRCFLCIWEHCLMAVLLALLVVLGRYSNAIFLRFIVNTVEAQYPLWIPLCALMFLFAFDLAGKLFTTRRDFYSFRAFLNIRAVLVPTIVDKMLKLTSSARAKYSAGEMQNLITTDVYRVRNFFWQFRDFVYDPFMILVSFAGLYAEIGWNTLFGVVVLIAILPLNYALSKLNNYFEQKQMTIKDARLKLVNDLLSGIRVLKLYAWEESMQRKVFELRRRELKTLRMIALLDAVTTISFQMAPLVATLVSFYGYTVIQGNPLLPDVAFVSLLFFSMLRYSIYALPQLIAYSIKAFVSGRRILAFLNEQELEHGHITRAQPDKDHPVVFLDQCSFTWGSSSSNKNSPSAPTTNVQPTTTNGNAVGGVNNDDDDDGSGAEIHLQNISLTMQAGELIGIVGRVGSGKSSLLAAILGEMERINVDGIQGRIQVFARSIGYVPQQPWIQNRTLRANVLFDAPLNQQRYREVISACALDADLDLLTARDLTEIGEKGINLSGGQKARVALARAVYMDADFYVLDDTLSAVDAHVGAHIFEKVIGKNGILRNKTRLWALNSLAFLRHCDRIVVMDGGRIHSIGTLEQLKQQQDGPFAALIQEYLRKHMEERNAQSSTIDVAAADYDSELDDVLSQFSGSPLSKSLLEQQRMLEQQQHAATAAISRSLPPNGSDTTKAATTATPSSTNPSAPHQHLTSRQQEWAPKKPQRFTIFRRSISSSVTVNVNPHHHRTFDEQPDTEEDALLEPDKRTADVQQPCQRTASEEAASELAGRLIEDEELAVGMVSRRVYLQYARAFGICLTIAFFASTLFGSSVFGGLSSVWLARWSSNAAVARNATESVRYLAVYGGLEGFYVLLTAIGGVIVAVGAYRASSHFHDQLVRALFRSPMAFFDRTPLGRIVNRLSNDIDRIDENIPWAISAAIGIFVEALNALISICIVIPALTLIIIPLLVIFLFIVHFYNLASVQLRRMTQKSWSYTCSFVQDAHLGADSIRVFDVVERFRDKCCKYSDWVNECYMTEIFTNRWLQVRLDILSDLVICICVLVAIVLASQNVISLGSLAMIIGCGYTFTGYLGEVARVWRESEVQMVCIERVSEYIRNEPEAPWRISTTRRSPNWPSGGQIQFKDLCLRYRPGTDLVLNNVNFVIEGGEKVGIVGRTGAGKTSLTLALFRIVEPCSGQILIDGIDICTLGLHDLREALTIIPQDPVLFCGTFRMNLDPFDEYSDDQLWDALAKTHLKEKVSELPGQLCHELSEGGKNLSTGERQLVCLARAVLRQNTRILVLDEATANVDTNTDARIQASIREQFRNCTLLTIAHRINTILDYDRILVMSAGSVAEFDSPTMLMANPGSLFAQLAKQAGIVSVISAKGTGAAGDANDA